jgi:hypothetical protein
MHILARAGAGLVALFGLALGLLFYLSTEQAAALFFVDPQGAAACSVDR